MFGLGMTELLIILLVVVVIFGARRLPEIGGGLGKAIRNFRKGASGQDTGKENEGEPSEIEEKTVKTQGGDPKKT